MNAELSSVSAATGIIMEIAGLTGNGNHSRCQRSSSTVVAAAIAITFGHCYIGITKNISNGRTTIKLLFRV